MLLVSTCLQCSVFIFMCVCVCVCVSCVSWCCCPKLCHAWLVLIWLGVRLLCRRRVCMESMRAADHRDWPSASQVNRSPVCVCMSVCVYLCVCVMLVCVSCEKCETCWTWTWTFGCEATSWSYLGKRRTSFDEIVKWNWSTCVREGEGKRKWEDKNKSECVFAWGLVELWLWLQHRTSHPS